MRLTTLAAIPILLLVSCGEERPAVVAPVEQGEVVAEAAAPLDEAPPPISVAIPSAPVLDLPEVTGPGAARTRRRMKNFLLNPAFSGREFALHDFRPFLLAEELDGEESDVELARAAGQDCLVVYERVLTFLRAATGFEIPRLEGGPSDGDRFLVIVFRSRSSFERWHEYKGGYGPRTPYYSPGGNRLIATDRESLRGPGLRRLACYAVLHGVRRRLVQKDDDRYADENDEPREEVQWGDARLSPALHWFQRGLACHLGNPGRKDSPGRATLMASRQLEYLQPTPDQSATELWQLREMLFSDAVQLRARAKVKSGGLHEDVYLALHEAQAWVLLDLMLATDDGPWRIVFRDMLRADLTGYSPTRVLQVALGGKSVRSDDRELKKGIARLQAEFDRHLKELLEMERPR